MFNKKSYCRSCGVSNPQKGALLTESWQNKNLFEIFEECIGINVVTDNFSKTLCILCHEKLIQFYDFRLLTRDIHARLVKELANVEIKEENDEIVKEEVIVTPLMMDLEHNGKIEIDDDHDDDDDDNELKVSKMTPLKTSFICIGCQQSFQNAYQLSVHKRETRGDFTHLLRCNDCIINFNLRKELKLHLFKFHKERICNECDTIVNGSTALTIHTKEFHRKTKTRIDCCPYCAKFVKSLRNHVAVVHKRLKRHYCSVCNRGCVTKDTLRIHMRIHTGEKPFKCSFPGCDKSFKQRGQVGAHERKFHGTGPAEVPIPCDICKKIFKNKYTLKEHRKLHFGVELKCDQCESTFMLQRYLTEHIKDVHTVDPVVCDDCGKMFKTPKKLQYHRRQHTGTDYICKICDKFFVNKRLLLDHTNSQHEKVRKYVCEFVGCDRAYYRSDNLRKHRRKCHSDK